MKFSPKGNESELAVPEPSLGRCLVDGDSAATATGRRQRRRALGISIAIEAAALALLLILPLMRSVAQPIFSKPTSVPYFFGTPHQSNTQPPQPEPNIRLMNHSPHPVWFNTGYVEPHPPVHTLVDETNVGDPAGESREAGWPGMIPLGNFGITMKDPSPPSAETNKPDQKRTMKVTEGVEQAQLILRVEPRYPPLAVQVKKEGKVILHAIINRDGSITSLDVLSGPPLLVQAALEAVREWRYRPTLLNGEPVEVETTITVIFRLQH